MSTLVELITAVVLSVFGIATEEPPALLTEAAVIECCEYKTEPASDMLVLNISSIKIEHNSNENKLL